MLRRNGKPRSCEPCRISKIRCDHATPTCGKCQARGITNQCFYHPAPMTKPPGTPRKQPEARRRVVRPRYSETRESRDHGRPPLHLSPTMTLRNDIHTVTSSHAGNPLLTSPESSTRTTQSALGSARSFYLGSTSYASVFAEEGPVPDSLHQQPSERMSPTPSAISSRMAGSRHCQMGIGPSIVSKLAPFSLFEKSIQMRFGIDKASALVGPLILSALPQLRKDLEQLSGTGSDPYSAYAEITRNTARPFKVPSSMLASQFHTLFTGQNLRWDVSSGLPA